MTPDEWVEATGQEEVVSDEEKASFFQRIPTARSFENETISLPWTPEEELLVVRVAPPVQVGPSNTSVSPIRSVSLFAAMLGLAYGMMKASVFTNRPDACANAKAEKFLV